MNGGTTPEVDGLTGLRQIGVGGSSRVYVGVDEAFGRHVAVKVLHQLDDKGRRRFDRERQLMGRFDGHPHVITPYRSGYTADGSAYLVMEHAANGSLQDHLDRGHLFHWDQAVAYLTPVARALEAAHRQQILHLDIKPANILLTADWVPKLTDFGISALQEGTATASLTFTLAHTPPETFAGGVDQRDERSDLYSLASTLYAMVAGRAPFEVDGPDSQPAYLLRIADNPVPPLGRGVDVDRFFATALAKNPTARPPTVDALLNNLPTDDSGGPSATGPVTDGNASWGPPERATRHVAPPPPDPPVPSGPGPGGQRLLMWAVAGVVAILGGLLVASQILDGEDSARGGDDPDVVEAEHDDVTERAGQVPDGDQDTEPEASTDGDRDTEPEASTDGDRDTEPDPAADQEVADRVVLQTADLDETWQASTRPPRSETLATYEAIPACAAAVPAIRGDGETATAGRDQSFSAGTTAVGVTVTFYETEQLATERGPLLTLDRDFQQCTRTILEQSITATNPTLTNLASESGALPAPDYGQRTEAVQYLTSFELDPLGPKTFYLNEWVVQIGRAVLVMTWSSDVAFDAREVEILQIVATRFEAELASVGG